MALKKIRSFSTMQRIISEAPGRYAKAGRWITVAEIARDFHVSYHTAWNGIHALCREAQAVCRPGKGIYFGTPPAGDGEKKGPVTGDSARSLAEKIEHAIREGRYKVGSPLPKGVYLVRTERVSPSTVSAAFRLLHQENLAYKQGKLWYAGRPPRREQTGDLPRIHSDPPVVYILVPNMNLWYTVASRNSFISPFFYSLQSELEKFGIEMRMALFDPGYPSPAVLFSRTLDELTSRIRLLGRRYRGSLLLSMLIDTRGQRRVIIPWIRRSLELRRPVVMMDPVLRKEPLAQLDRRLLPEGGRFYRCHVSEPRSIRVAVDALARMGHRLLGYPLPDHRSAHERIRMLRTAAAEAGSDLRIVETPLGRPFFDPTGRQHPFFSAGEVFANVTALLEETGIPLPPGGSAVKRSKFQDRFASLAGLIGRGVTAIVAFNDALAHGFAYCLSYGGYRIPGDISLISFDHQEESVVFPISTVDFGWTDLGYRAAHIFIGDIPVKTDDQYGNIASRPFLVDRGSVGRVK